jgi:hypothetical protein
MAENREIRRRRFMPLARFPLNTYKDQVKSAERRTLRTRRVDDSELTEPRCDDVVAELC